VGPFDSLAIICAPAQMALEHAVMMAMEGASSYTLAGGVLRLRNPIGTVLIGFRPLGAGGG
jgi:heat shock protein HslJ